MPSKKLNKKTSSKKSYCLSNTPLALVHRCTENPVHQCTEKSGDESLRLLGYGKSQNHGKQLQIVVTCCVCPCARRAYIRKPDNCVYARVYTTVTFPYASVSRSCCLRFELEQSQSNRGLPTMRNWGRSASASASASASSSASSSASISTSASSSSSAEAIPYHLKL